MSIVEALPQKLTKLAGITLIRSSGEPEKEKAGPAPKQRVSEENKEDQGRESFPEPHINLTVIKDGRQKKFNDFRKELNIEQARQQIREPNLTKKRKPIAEGVCSICLKVKVQIPLS